MSISDDSFWKFTFYGDNLKYIHYRFCIAGTGEYVTDTYVTSPIDVYSGEEITIPHDSNDGIFVNGNNYKYSIILFQQDYNIPVIRGHIRGSESTTTIYLPYGVTNVVTADKKAGTVKYFQNNMSFWLYALKALNNNTYKAIECLQLPFNPCLTENSFSFVAGNINNSNIDVGYRYKVQFDKFLNKSPLFLLRTISGQNIIVSATEVSFTIDNEVSALPYTITVNFEKSGGENYRIL